MRVLILDGHGAVGQAAATELGGTGVTAVLAGRDPDRYQQVLNLRGDLADLYHAAGQAAVVVNASGVQNPRLAERSSAAGAAFVEVSGNGDYLAELASAKIRTPVLAGARLVPVLAGLLAKDAMHHTAASVGAADPVEVGVVLGAGDPESAVDTGSTYALLGSYFTDPANGEEVRNFSAPRDFDLPDGSSRSLVRVNFPDQGMLTAAIGRPVRTWFATSDRFTTGVLRGLSRVRGGNRLPAAFHFPGKDAWQVFARAGQGSATASSWASGRRQAPYTARILALAARRAPTLEPGLHRIQDVLSLNDLADLEGLELGRSLATQR